MKTIVVVIMVFFCSSNLWASKPFCKSLFSNAKEYLVNPNIYRIIENWDNKILVVEMYAPKTMAAAGYKKSEYKLYKKHVGQSNGYFFDTDTGGKTILVIDGNETKRTQLNTLFHENAHIRYSALLNKNSIPTYSVLKQLNKGKFKKRRTILDEIIDEILAHRIAEDSVSLNKKAVTFLSLVAHVKYNYDISNKNFKDFIALVYLATQKTGLTLEELKIHQIILFASKTTWTDIDQVQSNKAFRIFRRNFSNAVKASPEYI